MGRGDLDLETGALPRRARVVQRRLKCGDGHVGAVQAIAQHGGDVDGPVDRILGHRRGEVDQLEGGPGRIGLHPTHEDTQVDTRPARPRGDRVFGHELVGEVDRLLVPIGGHAGLDGPQQGFGPRVGLLGRGMSGQGEIGCQRRAPTGHREPCPGQERAAAGGRIGRDDLGLPPGLQRPLDVAPLLEKVGSQGESVDRDLTAGLSSERQQGVDGPLAPFRPIGMQAEQARPIGTGRIGILLDEGAGRLAHGLGFAGGQSRPRQTEQCGLDVRGSAALLRHRPVVLHRTCRVVVLDQGGQTQMGARADDGLAEAVEQAFVPGARAGVRLALLQQASRSQETEGGDGPPGVPLVDRVEAFDRQRVGSGALIEQRQIEERARTHVVRGTPADQPSEQATRLRVVAGGHERFGQPEARRLDLVRRRIGRQQRSIGLGRLVETLRCGQQIGPLQRRRRRGLAGGVLAEQPLEEFVRRHRLAEFPTALGCSQQREGSPRIVGMVPGELLELTDGQVGHAVLLELLDESPIAIGVRPGVLGRDRRSHREDRDEHTDEDPGRPRDEDMRSLHVSSQRTVRGSPACGVRVRGDGSDGGTGSSRAGG